MLKYSHILSLYSHILSLYSHVLSLYSQVVYILALIRNLKVYDLTSVPFTLCIYLNSLNTRK